MPLLYAAIAAGFFVLEFSGSERISDSSGAIELSAYTLAPNAHRDGEVRRLQLSTDGFIVDLSRGSGVVRRTASGRGELLDVIDFEKRGGGFVVYLQDGFAIEIVNEPGTDEVVQIAFVAPQSAPDARAYELAFAPAENSEFRRTENSPIIEIQIGDRVYNLILPDQAVYDAVNRKIVFPGEAATQTLRYVYEPTPEPGTLATWFRSSDLEISDSSWDRVRSQYIDATLDGWLDDRFSSSTGLWRHPEGGEFFDERILIYLLSDAWNTDSYSRVFNEMRSAAQMHSNGVSFRSAPFLGNLNGVTAEMRSALADQESEIRSSLRTGSPSLFSRGEPLLSETVYDSVARIGDEQLENDLLRFFRIVQADELSFGQALHVLEMYHLYNDASPEVRDALEGISGELVERIIAQTRRTENGFFVETDAGESDIIYSIRSGIVLSATDDDERVEQLGRNLVVSALERADELGTLPRYLSLEGASVTDSSGVVAPEEIFHLLRRDAVGVRLESLSDAFGPGAFLFSLVEPHSVTATANEVRVRFTNPPNQTHYMIMQGIPTFARLELFGLTWRNDPRFEEYSRGRNYNAAEETLKIKYTDNSPNGRVIFEFAE